MIYRLLVYPVDRKVLAVCCRRKCRDDLRIYALQQETGKYEYDHVTAIATTYLFINEKLLERRSACILRRKTPLQRRACRRRGRRHSSYLKPSATPAPATDLMIIDQYYYYIFTDLDDKFRKNSTEKHIVDFRRTVDKYNMSSL